MTRINFELVELTGRKSGKCSVCGKPAKRAERFGQTLNPFNKRDGVIKSHQQIVDEIKAERTNWLALPVCHARCEP